MDDTNCELATWQGDTSFDPLRYEYMSGVPSTLDISISRETPWGEKCQYTVANSISERDQEISFSNESLTGFTLEFQDDNSGGTADNEVVLTSVASVWDPSTMTDVIGPSV